MATKIKRLTEEERKAELKAYAFAEGLKGFFNDSSVPVLDSTPISPQNTVSDSIPVSDSAPISPQNTVSNSIPVSDSAPISPQNTVLNSVPVLKTKRSGNSTHHESDSYRDNFCITALRTLKRQNKSLAALGMLFLLRSLLPPSGGRLKIDRIVSATGMSKSNILTQLEALENAGLIATLGRDISGRMITFPLGIENETGIESDTQLCSSSIYKKTTTSEGTENGMGIENETGIGFNTDKNDIDSMFANKLRHNIISLKFSAQEFFFIAKASKVCIDKLTEQCFRYYHNLKGETNVRYANGLFLNLLSKAKDNPTAYVVKAIQQGATASQDDEIRAEKILKAGDAIFKELGVDILRKELENALLLLSSNGQSQNMMKEECESFVARMVLK
jgi:DNA-binding transcriptional ArsR family regulator